MEKKSEPRMRSGNDCMTFTTQVVALRVCTQFTVEDVFAVFVCLVSLCRSMRSVQGWGRDVPGALGIVVIEGAVRRRGRVSGRCIYAGG